MHLLTVAAVAAAAAAAGAAGAGTAAGAATGAAAGAAALRHDACVLAATAFLPLGLVLLTEVLKDRQLLSSAHSRKFLHIATGPLFLLTWPLYSDAPAARFLAAVLPALMALRFALAGLGLTREPRLVAGTARSGQRQELLRGPLLYGIAHVALCVVLWRRHPGGPAGVAALCAGDGLADVAGRAWGRRRLPHNKNKTWVGSVACWAASFLASAALLAHFQQLGLCPALRGVGWQHLLAGCAACGLAAALVESLPLADADNLLVPGAAAAVAHWVFPTPP